MKKAAENALQTMVVNLREKTGKSLEQWIAISRKSGFQKHGEIVKFLKVEHALTHGYANLVALRTLAAASGEADPIDSQYQGARAPLRPIYDALVAVARKLGSDVEFSPKKTGVSLRRTRQFALIQPASNTRIDLGLRLDGVPIGGRLGKWPSTMCTHGVRLESLGDVDRQVQAWLKQAYQGS